MTDRQVLLEQFSPAKLDDDLIWELIHKTECFHDPEFDKPDQATGARIQIEFDDGFTVEDSLPWPKGYDPIITNEDIRTKWRKLSRSVIDEERAQQIEDLVLGLDKADEAAIHKLCDLLTGPVRNAMA